MAEASETTDGRVLRGQRNRQSIVDALIRLYVSGNYTPTAAEVASEAGVSTRAVYSHFEDREALVTAVAATLEQPRRACLDGPLPTGDLPGRVDWLVSARATYYETAAPITRAAYLVSHTNDAVARRLAADRAAFRRQVADLFGAELDAFVGDERTRVLDAVDVSVSWDVYQRLTAAHGLERDDAVRVMRSMVLALFGAA